MRVVRGLARVVVVVVGVASLLATGCRGTDAPEAGPPEGSGAPGESTAQAGAERPGAQAAFFVSSPAFRDGGTIPTMYCRTGVTGGRDISPPLEWGGAPEGTASFAVVVIDRHPVARDWVHWAVVDIPPTVTRLTEGASPNGMPTGARELENSFGERGWGGPQPPPGTGEHRYEITVYAIRTDRLDIGPSASAAEIERALEPWALAKATTSGVFGR